MRLSRLLKPLLYAVLFAALWAVGRGFGGAFAATAQGSVKEGGHFVLWLLAYVTLGLTLGLLAAWDIGNWLGSASERFILGTGGRALRFDPRIKQAEQLLAKQQPLEAIHLLREYLTDKPRAWQIAIRIAEIYQGPLHSPLAAVLEYEAILQNQRPPRPARPWILLRLGDAFLHLDKAAEATARFEEIVHKYPRSGAADKARRRLAAAAPETADEPPAEAAPETPPARPALPPGFRPLGEKPPRRR
jgi:hypothetical protein